MTPTHRAEQPPSVRWIRAAAAWAAARPRAAGAVLLGLALLAAAADAVYVVGNGESAALRRFGRLIDDAVPPGLGARLPWGVDGLTRVRTGEVLRREVGDDLSRQLALVTGDENFIDLTLVVQYTISRLGQYLFAVDDPTLLLDEAVRAAVVRTVGAMPVDDVLTSGKAQIQNEVRRAAQATLDGAGAGISLLGINLQSASPPPEAAQAFRDVNDAKADAARAVNEAQSGRERAVSLARGDASRLVQEARGGADARLQQARGATERYAELLARKKAAPEQTATELYLNAMQAVLPRARLVLLAPGEVPRIDLNLLAPRP